MATILDIGLLQQFDVIFPFIFVLVIVYAVLTRTEWMKEKQAIALVLAFVLAVMTLFSNIAVKSINRMAPWFVLLVVFGILLLLVYQALGVKESTITDIITKSDYSGTIAWWILALMLIIGIGTVTSVVSEEVGFTELPEGEDAKMAPGTEEAGFWDTLFHPKILGIALILLIALFTVQKLASKE